MKFTHLLLKLKRKMDIELDYYCLQLEAWEKEIKEREKMVIAGKVKPGSVTDEDWGNFVNLRGALMSMPLHDYPALYDAIYKSNSMEKMREQELPEEVKIGFTSMMIVGMENCFRLLRNMKESGQIIITADGEHESKGFRLTLDAEGRAATMFTYIGRVNDKDFIPPDNGGEKQIADHAGMEGTGDTEPD